MYSILHVRLLGAPWQADTVAFRDRLRAEPCGRTAHEQAKADAAAEHARGADFDDYTRAKSAFFRAAPWPGRPQANPLPERRARLAGLRIGVTVPPARARIVPVELPAKPYRPGPDGRCAGKPASHLS